MSPPLATVSDHSAGGVLYRTPQAGALQVCLIATKCGSRWQLPKGHAAEGESDAEAARREVREETGCDGEVEEELGEIGFWFFVGAGHSRRRVRKTVRFFLVRYLAGETTDHDLEVDAAAWLDAGKAMGRLTFDSERRVLASAIDRLRARQGPSMNA